MNAALQTLISVSMRKEDDSVEPYRLFVCSHWFQPAACCPSEKPCSSNSPLLPICLAFPTILSLVLFSPACSVALQQLISIEYKATTSAGFQLHFHLPLPELMRFLSPRSLLFSFNLLLFPPSFSPWNARRNIQSLSQTQRERETGTEYRTCRLERDSDFFSFFSFLFP